jgi:serine/threonine protein kinase
MNSLLDYQQIIIRSTYERNNVALVVAPPSDTSLRALTQQLRRDMQAFAAPDQQLLDSLLTMLQKDVDAEPASAAVSAFASDAAAAAAAAPAAAPSDDDVKRAHSVLEAALSQRGILPSNAAAATPSSSSAAGDASGATAVAVSSSPDDSGGGGGDAGGTADPRGTIKFATEELYERGSVWDVYTRKGVLGKGGCGVVYKVVNKSTKATFALKQMKKDSYLLDILEREIMLMKEFDHPHLTKLREAYLDDKYISLVMDYVAGGELFDKIAELESFSETDAADITKQLLSALQYLHERNCAHRDIKAENILLVDKEGTQVKIADFGLANTLGNRNKFMSFVGTTPYMAPEVLSGATYGTNVDMWSLGVLVFVMLAGYMPFSGKTEMQEIRAILGGQYKFDDRRGWDKISAAAKNFISNLLLQDPEARFTATQALQHVWIRGRTNSGHSLPSLHNIKSFQRESKRNHQVKIETADEAVATAAAAAAAAAASAAAAPAPAAANKK